MTQLYDDKVENDGQQFKEKSLRGQTLILRMNPLIELKFYNMRHVNCGRKGVRLGFLEWTVMEGEK